MNNQTFDIRRDVSRVIDWVCWNTGSDQYAELRKAAERVRLAKMQVKKSQEIFEVARRDKLIAEIEETEALSNLVKVYLTEISRETENEILTLIQH